MLIEQGVGADPLTTALRASFGFDSFRPHQEEIVRAILSGRDVFAALPTGGGKSLCYQLPAILREGLTVVVSPLIALMQDQVAGARELGIPAAYLNSTTDARDAAFTWASIEQGETKLLYVAPERIAVESFRSRLGSYAISHFAVDEAHCISEWGHEFRPDYRALEVLRSEFPAVPIGAFTATATRKVQSDIVTILGLRDPLAVRGDFNRREIFYRVVRKDKIDRQIAAFVADRPNQPGIVYRSTRKSVEATAKHLRGLGVAAAPYHAGLDSETRRRNQEAFVRDRVQVIVATIAFGMGIDKSNVRWVVHGDLPRSIEAYYQETGRAGRDGESADTCLFYSAQDIALIRYHIDRAESEDERERGLRNLRGVLNFVDSGVCRRIQLLDHFDQEHDDRCDACDVCTGEVRMVDETVAAQKVLSAAYRTGQRFGAHHLVDVLLGSDTEKVRRFGHDTIKTFGVGADRSKGWWLGFIRDAEAAGLLVRADGVASALRIAERGRRVLRGDERFDVAERVDADRRRTTAKRNASGGGGIDGGGDRLGMPDVADVPPSAEEESRFEVLRGLRARLAGEQGVPPYVVFSDKTLRIMARRLPQTTAELLEVHGVGEFKAAKYGEAFLSEIAGLS